MKLTGLNQKLSGPFNIFVNEDSSQTLTAH